MQQVGNASKVSKKFWEKMCCGGSENFLILEGGSVLGDSFFQGGGGQRILGTMKNCIIVV